MTQSLGRPVIMDLNVPTSTQEATYVDSGYQDKKRHQLAALIPFCVSTTQKPLLRDPQTHPLLSRSSHYILLLFQGFLVALQYGFANGEVCSHVAI